jgi:putative membrane protein
MMKRILAAAVLALTACGDSADDARTSTADAPPAAQEAAAAPAPAQPVPVVTDPQIAAIVVAANEVDIRAGELARERGSSVEVKAFAERMVTDHTGVNKAASELVGRLGVTPEANPTSESLTRDGEQARARLQGESGAAFDRAYIANEVAYHQAVLDAIDQTLVPGARNAELKALLEQTRPAVAAHLDHARELQGTLGGA